MSLINEALKKAQHLRTHSAGDAAPLPGETGPVVRRGQPRSARSIVLMVCGGVVLIVLTAVGTVYFFNRPVASKPAPVVAFAATAHKPADPDAPAVAPEISLPLPKPATANEPTVTAAKNARETSAAPVARQPTPVDAGKPAVPPEPTSTAIPVSDPNATATTVASNSPAPAPGVENMPAKPENVPVAAKPDERIQAWVDAVKIGGIRAAGADSKVFMKDRLFRINDIVDRTLAIRLVRVETDSITFSDANGVTYVKTF